MSDSESDPDFVNNTTFRYDKPHSKRGRSAQPRDGGRKRREALKDKGDNKLAKGSNRRKRTGISSQSSLLEYFVGVDGLDMLSDSDASAKHDDDSAEEEMYLEDEQSGSEAEEEVEPMVMPTTFAVVETQQNTQLGESETESDEDETIEAPQLPTPTRRSCKDDQDASVTESDSEYETVAAATLPTAIPPSIGQDNASRQQRRTEEQSLTESDSDDETEPSQVERPQVRPGLSLPNLQLPQNYIAKPLFARAISQPALGPLVLGKSIAVPGSINTFLREYQRDGIKFFYERYTQRRGGLLGDDMGKTIQVISFLSAIMRKHGDERDIDRRRKHVALLQESDDWAKYRRLPPADLTWPTCLIIAPSSVVYNWERELSVWGYFEVGIYIGTPEERKPVLIDYKLGRLDVVVTSFDTARTDISHLSNLPWSVIIVDEAHKLKNPTAKITRAFHQFTRVPSPLHPSKGQSQNQSQADELLHKAKLKRVSGLGVRFGLTGTAIQNSYRELWTVLDWANPGSVGSDKEWTAHVTKPLVVGQSASAKDEERAKAKAVAKILVEKILPRCFLRRTKDLIRHQLPKKTDEVVFCPLTPKQIQIYKRILATDDVVDLTRKNEPCDCGSNKKRGKCCHKVKPGAIFSYISILIKISNHLALILPSPTDNEEQTRRNRELSQVAFQNETIPKYGPAMLLPQYCGKWDVLNLLLKDWQRENQAKVLIFTKSVKLLDMLDYHMNTNGYKFCRLDGSTKQSDRMPLIDEFNNDPTVFAFLISTLAGGTGLNLTGANKVVIFDPNWNPAHDLQAMDRAYRFGQTRDVSVYRLLGAGSIEELIYARQVYKQQQMKIGYEASNQTRYFHGVQNDPTKRGELFGIENIFKLHEHTLATKMTIEKAHLAEFDWALAHMEGKPGDKRKRGVDDLGLEKEGKLRVDDTDLRGISALLFDDDIPSSQQNESVDQIQQILNTGAVKYVHENESLLKPSKVEEEAFKELKKKRRASKDAASTRAKKARKSVKAENDEEWPPPRRHQPPPLSPSSKFRLRQTTMVKMGLIRDVTELPAFATKFTGLPYEDQQRILGDIDREAKAGTGSSTPR